MAAAGFPSFLDGRARRVAIGAEHAAVSHLGPQDGSTALAVIEKLAGICRHGFCLPMATGWTGDGGSQDHGWLRQWCTPEAEKQSDSGLGTLKTSIVVTCQQGREVETVWKGP